MTDSSAELVVPSWGQVALRSAMVAALICAGYYAAGAIGIALQRVCGALAMERHTVGLRCPHLELHGRFPFVCSP